MVAFFTGWGFTAFALVGIVLVFAIAMVGLAKELRFVRALTEYLGSTRTGGEPPSLEIDGIRDGVELIENLGEPATALKQVRSWQMRAQRLEPALAFWIDLLRQLGLLFTVVGLGLALLVERGNVEELLKPLGLAVWTTVAGLFFSILLSARFAMAIAAWSDACAKNIEAFEQGIETK